MICTPSREALLALIQPDMKTIPKEFFKRIYGFEISYPGFSKQAITALENAGCLKARQYYENWVNEYETVREAGLKEVTHWYQLECEKQWEKMQKGGEEQRIQNIMQDLHQKSDKELLNLLQMLK
ncbi:MAG: hypothetical protein K1W16_14315 [Lachnospiraceae bacterium]